MRAVPSEREIRVHFIGNMAVRLTDGTHTVVTDFPYESGAFGYMTWLPGRVPDLRGALALVTHGHRDHFAAELLRPGLTVLGPADVRRGIEGPVLEPGPRVEWQGLVVRAIPTPHGPLEHCSYLLEWDGHRFYFTGDTEETDALLAQRDLDAASVSPWLLASLRKAGRRVDARAVIVYHHQADESVAPWQDARVPRQGEEWVVPPRDSSRGMSLREEDVIVPGRDGRCLAGTLTIPVTGRPPFSAAS